MGIKNQIRFKWLSNLTRWGVSPESEDDVSRRIIFSNVVFISLPIVYLFFMTMDYKTYLTPLYLLQFDQFIVPIVIVICFFCLWLNKVGFTRISRLLFLTTWPFLMHIIPINLLHSPDDYFIAFPFGLVFHAILIQLMVSHLKEPVWFWTYLGLNFITMTFAVDILIYNNSDPNALNTLAGNPFYTIDGILYWLLFNLVMFYILIIIEKYIRKVNSSKELIEAQKNELNIFNRELGKKVEQRTMELEKQNTKLKNYAFYNSHLLRAPFCRIQGLIQIQEMTAGPLEKNDEVSHRLRESVDELESVIRKIQQIVETELKNIA